MQKLLDSILKIGQKQS